MKGNIGKLVLTMALIVNLFSLISVAAADQTLQLFVSATAPNGGDGQIETPFNKLEQARDALRELKKNGQLPPGGATVNIRGGQYSISNSFTLEEQDSGTENGPITYRPYGNEPVSLVGGYEITLDQCEIADDTFSQSRLDPNVIGKVYKIDLKTLGISGYGKMYSNGQGAYGAYANGFLEKGSPDPQIFYNNEAMRLARYPNQGYALTGEILDPGDGIDYWIVEPESERNNPPHTMHFTIDDERIKRWGNANQAWMFGYWRFDWSDFTTPVAEIDLTNQSLKAGHLQAYDLISGQRFYIYNLLEELDSPGEWFYDNDSGILYLYPMDNNPDSKMLLSFSENPLIALEKASNINIREISFMGTRTSAIRANNCDNVSISYCSISRVSGEGIAAYGVSNFTIEGCHIFNTGSKGIDISGGNRDTLEQSGNLIINNWIHHFGELVKTYEGAVRFTDVGLTVKNNLMHDGVHLAITPGGNDNIIEYNEIHSVIKESSDMGAIYFNTGMTNRGNVIRYNLIRDLHTDSEQTHKIQGIYLDNSTSGQTITGNIFHNIGGDGVMLNGGRNNIIKGNIFANLDTGVTFTASGLAVTWGWYGGWLDGSRGYGLKGENLAPFNGPVYAKYPNMNGILDDNPPYPKYNVLEENVSYNTNREYFVNPLADTGTGITEDDMRKASTINAGLTGKKDYGFVAVNHNDFTLREDSEVYEKFPDFPRIDTSRIGLITSKLRSALSQDAIAMVMDKPRTYVNWERKFIDDNNYNAVPFIENQIPYIPLRFLAEALEAQVSWNDGAVEIEYEGSKIAVKENEISLNGNAVSVDGEIVNNDGRIFIPLDCVNVLFNKQVFWDDKGLVIISGESMEDKLNEDMVLDLINRL